MKMKLDPDLAIEAKALVVLAFRNGTIEDLHTERKPCAVCSGRPEVSHISDDEMKVLMKSAVNAMYRLLWQRDYEPAAYNQALAFGRRNTIHWDDPELGNRGEGHAQSDLPRRNPCLRSLPPTCGSAQSC